MDVDLDADVNSDEVTVIETGTYEDMEVDAKADPDSEIDIELEENVEVDVVQMWMQK